VARAASALLVLLAAGRAGADEPASQPAPAAQCSLAEALFREGRRLLAQGQVEAACPQFAESQRLEPAGGTLLNLALCHERIGRLATAWAEYREALRVAQREAQPEREQIARERSAALAPQLPFLTIVLAAGAAEPGLAVELDGVALPAPALGVATPVDPGPHRVVARRPGRAPYRVETRVAAAQRARVVVPRLGPAAPRPADAGRSRRLAGLITGGAGLAALAVGSAFGVRAIARGRDAASHCPGDVCDPQGVRLNDQARTSALVADVTLGVGLAAVVAGAYLWWTGRARATEERPPREPALALTPAAGPAGAGVTLRGRW
jgi:hypothetical protein